MARAPKTQIKEDLRALTGPERAAIFLLSLGEELGAKLWQMMDEDEIKEISQLMSTLGTVSATLVEKLLIEFVSQMSSTGSLMGSYESTERLLTRFMPGEKVGEIMEEIRGPAGRTMWDKLGNVNESVLANYLKNEYADGRRRALQDQVRACRPRLGGAAGGIRTRSRTAHAAHGI